MRGQADQIVAHRVGQSIDAVLIFVDAVDDLAVIVLQHIHGAVYAGAGQTGHGGDGLMGAGQSQGGGVEELLVQLAQFLFHVLSMDLIIRNDAPGQLFKLAANGQQNDSGGQTEQGVGVGDAAGGNGAAPDGVQCAAGVQDQHGGDDQNGGAQVENDVDQTGALGVCLRTDGAHDSGGNAVADVYADNDGIDGTEGQSAGDGQSLKNTDGGGGALNEEGHAGTHQEAQNGDIGQTYESLGKGFGLREGRDSGSHVQQSGKQNSEAHGDAAQCVGVMKVEGHDQQDADDGGQRGQGGGLEQIQPGGPVGVQVQQTDDLTGDGGTYVGAQHDAQGLVQRDNPRAHQTGGDHDGGGGALDHGGDHKAHKETHHGVVGHFLHSGLEGSG